MIEIEVKNIPIFLKNSELYKNLNVDEEESKIFIPIMNENVFSGKIETSEDFLNYTKLIDFFGGIVTTEMYKYIVNNILTYKDLVKDTSYIFSEIWDFNSLYDLYDFSVKNDNLDLYIALFEVFNKKFTYKEIFCDNKKFTYKGLFCDDKKFKNKRDTIRNIILNFLGDYETHDVAKFGAYKCLKFLFKQNNYNKEFDFAILDAFKNGHYKCLKFLYENNVPFIYCQSNFEIPKNDDGYNKCYKFLIEMGEFKNSI